MGSFQEDDRVWQCERHSNWRAGDLLFTIRVTPLWRVGEPLQPVVQQLGKQETRQWHVRVAEPGIAWPTLFMLSYLSNFPAVNLMGLRWQVKNIVVKDPTQGGVLH